MSDLIFRLEYPAEIDFEENGWLTGPRTFTDLPPALGAACELSNHTVICRVIDQYNRIIEVAQEGEVLNRTERNWHSHRAGRETEVMKYRLEYIDDLHWHDLDGLFADEEGADFARYSRAARVIHFADDADTAFGFCDRLQSIFGGAVPSSHKFTDELRLYWYNDEGKEHLGWTWQLSPYPIDLYDF